MLYRDKLTVFIADWFHGVRKSSDHIMTIHSAYPHLVKDRHTHTLT